VELDSEREGPSVSPRVAIIRAKMDYGTAKKVQNALIKLGPDGKSIELTTGDQQIELLVVNLVAWRGGDLDNVPCTPENIRRLDPTDPFWDRVLEEIGQRNRRREGFDPNGRTTNGAGSSMANALVAPLVNGTSS
jgi:hypothetical protein